MTFRRTISRTDFLHHGGHFSKDTENKSEGISGSSQPQTMAEGFPATNFLWSWGDLDMTTPKFPEIDAAVFFEKYNCVAESESCIICGGAHSHFFCGLKYSCPIDQKVGDDFVVICICNNIVIHGKCPKNCGSTWGRAILKHNPFGYKLEDKGPQAEPKHELKNRKGVGESEFCGICAGAHSQYVCGLKYRCPLDRRVGKDFVVHCFCNNIVIDGKCPKNCGSTWGRVAYKHSNCFDLPSLDFFQTTKMKTFGGSSQPQTKAEGFPVTKSHLAEQKDELMDKKGLWSWGDLDVKTCEFPEIDAAVYFEKYNCVGECESCIICGGAHSHFFCALKYSCPIDQKVGDDFVVRCICNNIVIHGKCPKNCGSTWGRAILKHNPFGYKSEAKDVLLVPSFNPTQM